MGMVNHEGTFSRAARARSKNERITDELFSLIVVDLSINRTWTESIYKDVTVTIPTILFVQKL